MIKILQYGEGNFLRAFADWMIDVANEKGIIDAEVTVVPPRFHHGRTIEALMRQGGKYHVVLEGIEGGEERSETRLIRCIANAFSPDRNPELYDSLVTDPHLRFVVSNTTEAGIAYQPDDVTADIPATFPGKVTAMLYRRYRHYDGARDKGIIFICCELIEDNGQQLREIVMRHAKENSLGTGFMEWVKESCTFCDSLVDRIVAGFPADAAQTYPDDSIVVKGELYHNWVIGTPQWEQVQRELPLHKAGLHVAFCPSCREYRERKVRILNGCHTAMTPVALLMGLATVREAYTHPLINAYISRMMASEVLPMIPGESTELRRFADGILERFLNPHIEHRLTSIALNSLSKWEARLWPTVRDVYQREDRLASCAIFAFAALQALYASDSFEPQDSDLATFAPHFEAEVPGFDALVAEYTQRIKRDGIAEALAHILS